MHLYSASQVALFRNCQRAWAWAYLAGLKDSSGPAAALGTEVDDEQIQPYLRDGRPFDFTKRRSAEIAEAMRPLLPAPKTVEVQKHFVLPSPTWRSPDEHIGFGFQGYIDIYAGDAALFPGLDGGVPAVGDTKTTGSIAEWAKTEGQLREDPQAMLYATYAMFESGAREIALNWIYGQTKGAKKKKSVHLHVLAPHVAEQFEGINDTALEMNAIRLAAGAAGAGAAGAGAALEAYILGLPPSPTHCPAYGGCSHAPRCNLSPADVIDSLLAKAKPLYPNTPKEQNMTETLSVIEKLKAKRALLDAPAPPAINPPESTALPPAINPPESTALPPAQAIGSVILPPMPAETEPATPMAKAARGPKKTGVVNSLQSVVYPIVETVRVVWGEEKVFPLKFDSTVIGPFELTTDVRSGETVEEAMVRAYTHLARFADVVREEKLRSFAKFIGPLKGVPA